MFQKRNHKRCKLKSNDCALGKVILTDFWHLSARAFFFSKILKNRLLTQFLRNGSTEDIKSCILLSRIFQALTRCQKNFIIFTMSGVTGVRSDHGVMWSILYIGTLRFKQVLCFRTFMITNTQYFKGRN